jgi:hypothetical protein
MKEEATIMKTYATAYHNDAAEFIRIAAEFIRIAASGGERGHKLSRDEIIDSASRSVLVDYVRDGLSDYDVGDEVLRTVARMIAKAMLEQHRHTDDVVSEFFIASAERQGGF